MRSERETIEPAASASRSAMALLNYQGLIIRGLGSRHSEFRFGVCGPGPSMMCLSCAAASAAFSAAM